MSLSAWHGLPDILLFFRYIHTGVFFLFSVPSTHIPCKKSLKSSVFDCAMHTSVTDAQHVVTAYATLCMHVRRAVKTTNPRMHNMIGTVNGNRFIASVNFADYYRLPPSKNVYFSKRQVSSCMWLELGQTTVQLFDAPSGRDSVSVKKIKATETAIKRCMLLTGAVIRGNLPASVAVGCDGSQVVAYI